MAFTEGNKRPEATRLGPGVALALAPLQTGSSISVGAETQRAESGLTSAGARLESLDLLRGLVMVVMALDHVRDFFTNVPYEPTDLTKTFPALFLTRWITHFCAPVFIFLAGTGAFLSLGRGRTKRELSWFLLSRGIWLALLEITWVKCLGWGFNFDYHSTAAAILWAIGWSMVVLAALVFLPTWAVTLFGVVMIATHNAFDGILPADWGKLAWLWTVLHKGGSVEMAHGWHFIEAYPLIPWIGVMAAGYGFGAIFRQEPVARRRNIFLIGLGLTLAFVILRFANVYGDPRPWTSQSRPLYTFFSFLNCHKYPPSLLYLLMMLGPALMLLAWLERGTAPLFKPFLVFGHVPLFYYLLHLPFIHALAVLVAFMRYGRADWLFGSPFDTHTTIPSDNGFGLPVVYLFWVVVVLVLYPACRWFANVKRRNRSRWLTYL